MPRLPKYRLHKASGRAVIQWRPMFGVNPHYLPGPYGSKQSLAAYEKLRAAILAAHFGEPPPPPKPSKSSTVNGMTLAYLDWAESYYGGKDSTEFGHLWRVAQILRKYAGVVRVAEFGPIALKEVREAMIELGWARTSINHHVDRIRRIFRWGVENEWVSAVVLANLREVPGLRAGKTRARETKAVQPAAWPDVERVLPHVSPMVAAMIRIQWLTGMRSDELTGLRGMEIDRDGDVWLYKPEDHKNRWRGKSKVICFGPQAKSLLAPYLPENLEAFVFSPAGALRELQAARAAARKSPKYGRAKKLVPRVRDTQDRYTAHSYQQAINHGFRRLAATIEPAPRQRKGQGRKKLEKLSLLCERLGIVYWHPHQIRHSRSTITRAKYGIEGAQAQTGNSLEAAEIYAEKSLDLARRIAHETG